MDSVHSSVSWCSEVDRPRHLYSQPLSLRKMVKHTQVPTDVFVTLINKPPQCLFRMTHPLKCLCFKHLVLLVDTNSNSTSLTFNSLEHPRPLRFKRETLFSVPEGSSTSFPPPPDPFRYVNLSTTLLILSPGPSSLVLTVRVDFLVDSPSGRIKLRKEVSAEDRSEVL